MSARTDPFWAQRRADALGSEADKLRVQLVNLRAVHQKLLTWHVNAAVPLDHEALSLVDSALRGIVDSMSEIEGAIGELDDSAGDLNAVYEPKRNIGG